MCFGFELICARQARQPNTMMYQVKSVIIYATQQKKVIKLTATMYTTM